MKFKLVVFTLFSIIGFFGLRPAFAHFETLNGPIVKAAGKALDTNSVNLVLIWVREEREAEVKDAFKKASDVRKLSPEAKALADQFFFETVVRIHETDEGETYTGLKKADKLFAPATEAADRAVESGSPEPLFALLLPAVQAGVRSHLERLMSMKKFDPNDLESGRGYAVMYAEYTHYVEDLYDAATKAIMCNYCKADETKR